MKAFKPLNEKEQNAIRKAQEVIVLHAVSVREHARSRVTDRLKGCAEVFGK